MLKTPRESQVEKLIKAGLTNLFKSQKTLNFEQFIILTIENLMLLEREEYLRGKEGSDDIGNGSYIRNFCSLRTNSLQLQIPRTRKGVFKPIILELINQSQIEVNNLALLLYRKGLSTRDVSAILLEYFGENLSKDTINNLASTFHEIRKKWENQPLDAYYKVLYADVLYVSLRRGNNYSNEAVYIMYGVKDDNTRELLLLEVNPTEGSNQWKEYFRKLEQRGVHQIDLIVSGGLKGFREAATSIYPTADIQKCVVHLLRHTLNKVRPKDKASLAIDLKEVFNNFEESSSKQRAIEKAIAFSKKCEKEYPAITDKFMEEEYILDYITYIDYPPLVRRMVYTTNTIENLNRQIRKVIKTKVTFDKASNMLDLIYMVIKDFESINWQKYPVSNFQFWIKKHN